jgi:hypothetical protein
MSALTCAGFLEGLLFIPPAEMDNSIYDGRECCDWSGNMYVIWDK